MRVLRAWRPYPGKAANTRALTRSRLSRQHVCIAPRLVGDSQAGLPSVLSPCDSVGSQSVPRQRVMVPDPAHAAKELRTREPGRRGPPPGGGEGGFRESSGRALVHSLARLGCPLQSPRLRGLGPVRVRNVLARSDSRQRASSTARMNTSLSGVTHARPDLLPTSPPPAARQSPPRR